jgi:hypothetical protein
MKETPGIYENGDWVICQERIYLTAGDPYECAEVDCDLPNHHEGKHQTKIKDDDGRVIQIDWEVARIHPEIMKED